MDLAQTEEDGVDRMGLTQDRYRWRALEDAVMNLEFHICWGTIEWLHHWWPLEQCSTPNLLLLLFTQPVTEMSTSDRNKMFLGSKATRGA
jgi:hypothetical protein